MVTLSCGYMVTRQYASVIWSPYHLGEIAKLESVQRRFTKRLVGLRNMTYVGRINFLKLNSLEERGLRFDIIFTYNILFGLVNINCSDIQQQLVDMHINCTPKLAVLTFATTFIVIVSSTYGIVFPRVTVILKRSTLLNRF